MKIIVYLVDQVVNMGPENVVLNICRFIDRSKFYPIIFSLRNEDKNRTIEPEFKDLGIEIVHFGFSMLDLELKTAKIAKIVKSTFIEKGGDIIHAHCYHPQLIASKINGVKKIATIHNISGEDFVMKKGKCMGNYMKWRFDRTLPSIDCSIAISDYMMTYYIDMCKKLTKIPNGVFFKRSASFDTNTFKKQLGLAESKPIIVATGSIVKRKNISYLVSELKKINKDFYCIIVGTGDKLEACKEIVYADDRFRFEGFRNNVSDYLSIADYYISSSKSEGLPLSVLEALNMGVPTLLSDIKPHKEIVENININGVLCYPLETGALQSSIDKALTEIYDRSMIKQRANSIYSAPIMAREYESIYDSIQLLK